MMMAGTITTIFFDIGNVLVGFDHDLIWQRLATMSPFSAQQIRQRIAAHDLLNAYECGQLSSVDLFQALQALLEFPGSTSFESFCRLWGDIFWEQKPVMQLAEALHQRYAIMLLSNTNGIHWNLLTEKFPIFTQVDDAVLSFEIKAMKPATAIYQEAIRRAASPADHCVFIDDIELNIQAARSLGMHGICYHSPEQLIGELHTLNVQW